MGKIKKNSLILITKEGLLNISSIFVVGYLARELGAEDYGKLTFSISFGALFGIISNFGIRQYATREVVRYKEKARRIYGEVLFVRIFLSLLMIFTGVIISFIAGYSSDIKYLILIALISKAFFSYTTSNYIIFEAHEDMGYNAITQTTGRVIVIIFLLIALFVDANLFIIALIYLIGNISQFLISARIIYKKYFKPVIVPDIDNGIILLKKSFPFALFSVFTMIYFEIGKIMLFQLGSSRDVGLFQAASILAFRVLLVSDSVGTAIFPRIVELSKTDKRQFRNLAIKAIGIMSGIGVLIAGGMFLLADFIINIIYHSKEYLHSVVLLQTIVWVLPFMFVNKILSFLFVAQDKQKLLALIYFIILLVNILLNLLLIPEFEAIGAIWSLIFSEVFGVGIFIFYLVKLRLFTIGKDTV